MHSPALNSLLFRSVRFISRSSFPECPMKDFVICDSNCLFGVFDGLLLSKDHRVYYGCIGGLEEVVIPDSVEEFVRTAFPAARVFHMLHLASLLR